MKLHWVLGVVVCFLSVTLLFGDAGGQSAREAELRELNQSHQLRYLGGNEYIDDLTGEIWLAPPTFDDLLEPAASSGNR